MRHLIVLDDFYHVPYGDQPDVLAYLHQIVKNLGIYLKICGVKHRIQPFVEGDPPRGLQPGQDAGEVSLDITLERFTTAQTFLEQLLPAFREPFEISLSMTSSPTVVVSDWFLAPAVSLGTTSTSRSRRSGSRTSAGRTPTRPHNRIGAEDVNEAAADMSAQKQEDLWAFSVSVAVRPAGALVARCCGR